MTQQLRIDFPHHVMDRASKCLMVVRGVDKVGEVKG